MLWIKSHEALSWTLGATLVLLTPWAGGCGVSCPTDLVRKGEGCVPPDAGHDAQPDADAKTDAPPGACAACTASEACFEEGCVPADRCTAALGVPCGAAGPAMLKAGVPRADAAFGTAVSMSGDGTILAVGSPLETLSEGPVTEAGAVYLFRRVEARWLPNGRLTATSPASEDHFGERVALNGDGTVLVVGSPGADDAGEKSGAIEVYRRTGQSWEREQRVTGTGEAEDQLGIRVAINGDGTVVAASVRQFRSNIGEVHVFARASGTWTENGVVVSPTPEFGDAFIEVVLDGAGNTMAVGAHDEDSAAGGVDGNTKDNSVESSGAVYVFEKGESGWDLDGYIKASSPRMNDRFGTAVSLSADGNTLAVGAPGVDAMVGTQPALEVGLVYLFRRGNSAWEPDVEFRADRFAASEGFARWVSLSADGSRLAAGATGVNLGGAGVEPTTTEPAINSSGAVYLFERPSSGPWRQLVTLKASNPGSDFFGAGVAIGGKGQWLVAGAVGEDSNGTGPDNDDALSSGAAYVYRVR